MQFSVLWQQVISYQECYLIISLANAQSWKSSNWMGREYTAKIQYLLSLQVTRYCYLALNGKVLEQQRLLLEQHTYVTYKINTCFVDLFGWFQLISITEKSDWKNLTCWRNQQPQALLGMKCVSKQSELKCRNQKHKIMIGCLHTRQLQQAILTC